MQNQIQALAVLPKLSEQQLIQALQGGSGALPAYAVMAELEARKKRAAGFAGNGAAPRTSVKDDMVQQAGGIQSLAPQGQSMGVPPPAMQQPQQRPMGMAAGGMIPRYSGEYEDQLIAPSLYDREYPTTSRFERWADENRKKQIAALQKQDPTYNPDAVPSFANVVSGATTVPSFANVRSGVSTTPPRPPAQAPGIGSFSAHAGSRTGATGSSQPAFAVQPIGLRSVQDAMKDIPADSSIQDQIDAIKNSDTSEQNKKQAIGMMLFNWGAKTASTAGPTLSALGVGAQEGLKTYGAQDAENRREANERRKELGLLGIAKGRQGLERYDIGNRTRFGEAEVANKNQDNLFNAHKLAVESGDRALARATDIQVAGIHATASKVAQTDLGKQKLIADIVAKASDDYDNSFKEDPRNVFKIPPAEKERQRQAFIADRLKMLPWLKGAYAAPEATRGPDVIRGGGVPSGVKVRE